MIRIDSIIKDFDLSYPFISSIISKLSIRVFESEGERFITKEDFDTLKNYISKPAETEPGPELNDFIENLKMQIREKDKMIFRLIEIIEKILNEPQKIKLDEGSGQRIEIDDIPKVSEPAKNEESDTAKQVGRPVKYPAVDLSVYENNIDPALLYSASETVEKLKKYGIRLSEVRLRDLKSKKKIYALKDNRINMYYWPSLAYYYNLPDYPGDTENTVLKEDKPAEDDSIGIEVPQAGNETEKVEFISIKEIIKRLSDYGIIKSESTIRQLRNKKFIASKRVGNLKLFNWYDVLSFYKSLSGRRKA